MSARPIRSVAAAAAILACAACGSPTRRADTPPVPSEPGDPPAVHGMVLVGSTTVYASHLPLFHAPHDYQVIVELDLPDDAQRAYAADRAAHAGTIYTLVPESFVLSELVDVPDPRTSFLATIVRGHFERGGEPILEHVRVGVAELIHFRKLDAQETRPLGYRAILFGSTGEQFLAHWIAGVPDFDQLVAVVPVGRFDALTRDGLDVSLFDGDEPVANEPLTEDVRLTALTEDRGLRFEVRVKPGGYLERDELSVAGAHHRTIRRTATAGKWL